jgi:hypothetical protein
MDGKPGPSDVPAAAPQGEPAAGRAADAGAAAAASGSGERYGPLELRRLRKDDGRALILFSSVERQA